MTFLSNFFGFNNNSIKKLEQQAKEVLQLTSIHKAFRLPKEVIIINSSNNKILFKSKDVFPSNPERAILEINKSFNLSSIEEQCIPKASSKDIWTCGFRETEGRWVWYKNSEPKMTVSYNEAFKDGSLEDKVYFYSARYGTSVISKIKESSLESIAKQINALILERPYVKVACQKCANEDHYTIDDLVDSNKKPDYNSSNIVCLHCNSIVRLQ